MYMNAGQWLMTFYFSFWMLGQPDNWGDEPGEDCGQVVGYSNGHWNDDNCNNKRKYICKHINRKGQICAHRPTPHCVAVIKVFFCSQSWAAVRPDQWLESVWLQLLQAEGRHQEELVRGQAWLCDGRGGLGVRFVTTGGAVHHRNSGPVLFWCLDWLFHAGEGDPSQDQEPCWVCLLHRC